MSAVPSRPNSGGDPRLQRGPEPARALRAALPVLERPRAAATR